MCQEIRKNISYVAVPLAMMAFGFLSGRTPQGLSHARHTTPNAVAEVIAKASMPAPLEYRAVESVADALSREHADETLWAVSSWLTKAGSEDLPEMVLRLGGLSDSHLRAASLRRVLDLWVQQSQDVAWQWSRGHMESLSAAFGESYWKILFGALARQDSKTAKLHLAELSGEEYISARGSIESVLRLTSEREALLFLLGEESLGSASAASALMELLASEGPLIADEFRATLNDSQLSDEVVTALVRAVATEHLSANSDPTQALRWAQTLPNKAFRDEAIDAVISHMGKQSPDDACALLEAIPFWQKHTKAVRSVAAALMKEAPDKAMQWIGQSLAGTERFTMMQGLLNDGMQARPRHMAQLAESAGSSAIVAFVDFATIGGRLADEDPYAAWEWIKRLDIEAAADRAGATRAIASRLVEEDLDTAMGLYASIGEDHVHPDRLRQGFLNGAAETLGQTDPRRGMEWLKQLSGHEATVAAEALMTGWAESDPLEAAREIESVNVEDDQRAAMIRGLAGAWAKTDPKTAALWLAENSATADVVKVALEEWAQLDPMDVSQWLIEQPLGVHRDQGMATLALEALSLDPIAAQEWALAISEQETRDRTLVEFHRRWAAADPDAAIAALTQLGEVSWKEQLMEAIQRDRR